MQHKRKLISLFIICLLSIPLMAQSIQQVTIQGDSDNVELLQEAIQFLAGGFPSNETTITLGELPEDVPIDFTLPEDMALVGTINRGTTPAGESLEIWLLSELSPDDALTTISENFIADGWDEPDSGMGSMGGGFSPMQMTSLALCSADNNDNVWMFASERADTTYVSIQVVTGSASQFCNMTTMNNQPFPDAYSILPNLRAPEGVTTDIYRMGGGGGSGGGSVSSASSGTVINSELPLSAIFTAYADQVIEQGWQESASSADDIHAFGTWTLTDDNDLTWTAIMTITAYPDDSNQFYAYIRVENVPDAQ